MQSSIQRDQIRTRPTSHSNLANCYRFYDHDPVGHVMPQHTQHHLTLSHQPSRWCDSVGSDWVLTAHLFKVTVRWDKFPHQDSKSGSLPAHDEYEFNESHVRCLSTSLEVGAVGLSFGHFMHCHLRCVRSLSSCACLFFCVGAISGLIV